MKKELKASLCSFLILFLLAAPVWAADENSGEAADAKAALSDQPAEKDTTLVFNETDIRDVLRLIADEYNLNMVMSDDVVGTVTLRLKGASLQNTLDAILSGKGYDYEIRDNIIRVGKAEAVQAERTQRISREGQEPLVTEVFVLRYLDGNDVKDMIKSLLSVRGNVSVLERRPYRGFHFGTQGSGSGAYNSAQNTTPNASAVLAAAGAGGGGGGAAGTSGGGSNGLIRQRDEDEKPRSNTIMVSEVRSQMEKIRQVIAQVDVPPRQILIDARLLEVTTRTLEDLGIDFSNSSGISPGSDTNSVVTNINSGTSSTGINSNILTNTFPGNTDAGIHTVFTKIGGSDLSVVLHALSQDSRTKTLSAPRILTIENQEAAILVGEQFPIFQSTVTDQGTTTESLSYFQPIGISLQVIAQVTPESEISMIIHPTVSSLGSFVTGTSGLTQPRINTREADTRVLMKNGETLVIGGLLQDEDSRKYWSLPIINHVPVIGRLFTREQTSIDQKNLLIFITPHIVKAGQGNMTAAEKSTFKALSDPARYGYLHDRNAAIAQIYEAARKNYSSKHFEVAKAQFQEVLALDPEHMGAQKYLKKMNALPVEKPLS